ncbi:hypothetical protein [Algoriphagus aquimarinus]|uniref:Outer membrane protein assembly factor BamE n=1 Tax=Algoriphagus aquimarinus TaxID=237018 RepID=A0A5C7A9K5_9BACT|nr:hypothetical protein [Algoriphagus aquimarinus]TXE05130.1 hypothetical protein ESV85_18105 [Algoriphagus aquimarinus]
MSIEVPIIILILGAIIFFSIKWILTRFNLFNPNWRNEISFGLAFILGPIVYVSIFLIFIFTATYYPKKEFDKQLWISNPDIRYEMTGDLIDNNRLIGLSKNEVINLLGEDYYFSTDTSINYDVGFVPGLFNIDPDVTLIKLRNDKVVEVLQHET